MEIWTIDDEKEGQCSIYDIGKPKDVAPIPGAVILKADALRAYKELGGAEYLKSEPGLLHKLLVRQMPAEVHQAHTGEINIHISWASPDRLSYQHGEIIENEPGNVPDGNDGKIPALDGKPTAVPWKEPDPASVAAAVAAANGKPKESDPKEAPVQALHRPAEAESPEGKGVGTIGAADAPTLPPWIIEVPDTPGPKPTLINGQVRYFPDSEEGFRERAREKALEREARSKTRDKP